MKWYGRCYCIVNNFFIVSMQIGMVSVIASLRNFFIAVIVSLRNCMVAVIVF